MNRIATGIGLVSGMGLSAFWYKKCPHNDRAIKLARAAIEMAEPHLQCTRSELRKKERLYGKEIEQLMAESRLDDSGYLVDLTEHVWSSVMPNGKPDCYRVITGVDEKCVQIKEVHISA